MDRKTPATSTTIGDRRDLDSYLHSVGPASRLTVEQEQALAQAWRDRKCGESRQHLISSNLRLVVMVARKYAGRGIALDELVAEGNVGLIRAVDNFDPRAGARLGTYAVYWIRNSITEAFARSSGRARLSRAARADARRLEDAASTFRLLNGRPPDDAELSETLGWQPARVREVRSSIPARVRPLALSEADAPPSAQPEPAVMDSTSTGASAGVRELLSVLSPRERGAIELRFGIGDGQARSAAEIAETTGESPRSVRTCLETAMRKLARAATRLPSQPVRQSLLAIVA